MFISINRKSIYLRIYWTLIVEVKAECEIDDHCKRTEKCNKGSCVEACRLMYCGSNAICESGFHSAKCICTPGYTGNPQTSCTRCKFEIINSNKILQIWLKFESKKLYKSYSYFLNLQLGCQQSQSYQLGVMITKNVHCSMHAKIRNV